MTTSTSVQPLSQLTPQQYPDKIQRQLNKVTSVTDRVRRVITLVLGLISTLFSYMQRDLTIPENNREAFGQMRKQDPILYPAIRRLKRKRQVSPATVVAHLQSLEENHPQLQTFTQLLFPLSSNKANLSYLPDKSTLKNKPLLAIPCVIKGIFIDHIVTFLVDKSNNRIEFYDSKGYTIADYENSKLRGDSNDLTFKDLLSAILEKYGNTNTTITQNTKKHQHDLHNCGIYILDYLKRRTECVTPKHIRSHPLSSYQANNTTRQEMIDKLIEHYKNKHKTSA